MALREYAPGIHDVGGACFKFLVLESDRIAGLSEPILTLFSRVFSSEPRHIIQDWKASGFDDVLCYVMQQVQQFQRPGEAFVVHHQGSEIMSPTLEELKAASIPDLPPKDRVRRIPVEGRMEGIPVADIVQAMTDEQRRQLLDLLQRQAPPADE